MNTLISTKKVPHHIIGLSVTTYLGESHNLFTIDLKMDPFNKKTTEVMFYQHPETIYDIMQIYIGRLEFVQGVTFEVLESFKNNGIKYL